MARSQNNKTYSFKSVGETEKQQLEGVNIIPNEIPIGIKTPIQLGRGHSGLFQMHTNLANQIADNLRNLINTNHGERVGHYDFGANLEPLTFELGAQNIDTEAMRRITRTVKKYMPYVELLDFEPFVIRTGTQDLAKIGVRLTYTVPNLAQANPKGIEITLFTAG